MVNSNSHFERFFESKINWNFSGEPKVSLEESGMMENMDDIISWIIEEMLCQVVGRQESDMCSFLQLPGFYRIFLHHDFLNLFLIMAISWEDSADEVGKRLLVGPSYWLKPTNLIAFGMAVC